MEWKKENVSKAQLEQMQREYIERALAMQKSARISGYSVMTGEELLTAFKAEAADNSGSCADNADEVCPDTCPEICDETCFVPEKDCFGETAAQCEEEMIDTDINNEGLMKASEILEEMTKQTEIMKKLVENSESVGRCGEDGEDLPAEDGE